MPRIDAMLHEAQAEYARTGDLADHVVRLYVIVEAQQRHILALEKYAEHILLHEEQERLAQRARS